MLRCFHPVGETPDEGIGPTKEKHPTCRPGAPTRRIFQSLELPQPLETRSTWVDISLSDISTTNGNDENGLVLLGG